MWWKIISPVLEPGAVALEEHQPRRIREAEIAKDYTGSRRGS